MINSDYIFKTLIVFRKLDFVSQSSNVCSCTSPKVSTNLGFYTRIMCNENKDVNKLHKVLLLYEQDLLVICDVYHPVFCVKQS